MIAEKLLTTESKSTIFVVYFSFDSNDKLVSLFWFIVNRKYVLINLILAKLRLHDAIVKDNVRYKRIAIQIFRNIYVSYVSIRVLTSKCLIDFNF